MKLVSLETAKNQIYALHDHDDMLIELYIEASSESVVDYLKDAADSFLDSNGEVIVDSNDEPIVPSRVRVAVLFLVAVYYKNRDENPNGIFKMGFLPEPVTAILYPLRKPTAA